MSNIKQHLLIYCAALSAGTLLISNLAAVKLWNFFGIAVDGGVVVFPLTYILGDLIVEFYGHKIAKHIIWAGFIVNLLAVAVFFIVITLPAYEKWELQDAFSNILGFTPRIIFASLIAYVCSNLFNNFIFVHLKKSQTLCSKSFLARALGSSFFAHFVDSFLFETIAFLGVLPFQDFFMQAIFAYLLGMGFELLFSPLEAVIAITIKRKFNHDNL